MLCGAVVPWEFLHTTDPECKWAGALTELLKIISAICIAQLVGAVRTGTNEVQRPSRYGCDSLLWPLQNHVLELHGLARWSDIQTALLASIWGGVALGLSLKVRTLGEWTSVLAEPQKAYPMDAWSDA